jgi:hypothetical protein
VHGDHDVIGAGQWLLPIDELEVLVPNDERSHLSPAFVRVPHRRRQPSGAELAGVPFPEGYEAVARETLLAAHR